jgi:hypothetical protein
MEREVFRSHVLGTALSTFLIQKVYQHLMGAFTFPGYTLNKMPMKLWKRLSAPFEKCVEPKQDEKSTGPLLRRKEKVWNVILIVGLFTDVHRAHPSGTGLRQYCR